MHQGWRSIWVAKDARNNKDQIKQDKCNKNVFIMWNQKLMLCMWQEWVDEGYNLERDKQSYDWAEEGLLQQSGMDWYNWVDEESKLQRAMQWMGGGFH